MNDFLKVEKYSTKKFAVFTISYIYNLEILSLIFPPKRLYFNIPKSISPIILKKNISILKIVKIKVYAEVMRW